MPIMAKRKPKPGESSKPPRKPPQRSGKPLNVWLESELRDALDALLAKSRRSLTAEVSIALEEYLTRQGLWPPASSPSSPTDPPSPPAAG